MSGMSKRKAGRHERKLIPSTADDVMFVVMVEVQFHAMCQLHKRVNGTNLTYSPDMKSDMLRWRLLRLRYNCKTCGSGLIHCDQDGNPIVDRADKLPWCKPCRETGVPGRGDYRHRESEMKACRVVAQWTIQLNAQLRNQPVPVVDLGG